MANEQPNKDMQEQLEQLRQAISQDIDKKLDEKFAGAEKRLSDHVSRELSQQLDTATKDLKGQMQVHFEDMQDLVKGAADGYGGTLESIERQLKELSTKWDTKITDHDQVLQNHSGRLEKLERR
jgi:hypothetical protein